MQKINSSIKQAAWQVPALAVLAFLTALFVNYWHPDSIPVVGDWSEESRFSDNSGESLVISLEQAKLLFEQNQAVFVDARPESQYIEGHIHGALTIPWQDIDNYFNQAVQQLENAGTIITYCDGETCELSHDLALFLKEMGFENVRVLVNGWSIWRMAGLSVQGDNL
ncbi:Rhodanese-like domain-containing protein [Desulfonema limicola]|uniref:Rhodanese-like domain-containing protein n=1 Tax=Desulfonema limicola TaxID=45656 RepID=A0A975GFZ0_9BACT|nr:rhodanese-like domain-containing protein [Desulfonema limicola]QTA79665.1 Rhodanese-like domain-containing protein [Desulfonema limicola]